MVGYKRWLRKDIWIKSIKIATAALLSMIIAREIGLKNSMTAGIITVLSIQNTKRETVKTAVNRGLAFMCALFLAAVAFRVAGFSVWAFFLYLLLYTLLCLRMGWLEAITMNSVLISHFLAEKTMSPDMIGNEAMLFLIGAGMGILANLHLHRKQGEFERLADKVDIQIKQILRNMAHSLLHSDQKGNDRECFETLKQCLQEAGLCAAFNYNNQFFAADSYELAYVQMREQQSVVLQGICDNINSLCYLPAQATQVAGLLDEIEQSYHKDNTVEGLLLRLEEFWGVMKKEKLPEDREEFEARAILFYILKQIEKLLLIKREFIEKTVAF